MLSSRNQKKNLEGCARDGMIQHRIRLISACGSMGYLHRSLRGRSEVIAIRRRTAWSHDKRGESEIAGSVRILSVCILIITILLRFILKSGDEGRRSRKVID
jgi:hypothetical protein